MMKVYKNHRRLALGMSVGEGVGRQYVGPQSLLQSLDDWAEDASGNRQPVRPAFTAIWNWMHRSPTTPAPLGSAFPGPAVESLHAAGIFPAIFMHTTDFNRPDSRLQNWASGSYDTRLVEWGKQARITALPFALRLNQEMNADWAPWSTAFYEQTAKDHVLAWIRVVDKIREGLGTDSHLMKVWFTPMGSPPKELRTQDLNGHGIMDYYPGRGYVDWLGFDKYEPWGDARIPMIRLYRGIYDRVKSLGPQPVYIGETGMLALPGNDIIRGKWFEQGLDDIYVAKGWSRFKGLMYFNIDMTASENRDWRISGTAPRGLLTAWGRIMVQPRYQRKLP